MKYKLNNQLFGGRGSTSPTPGKDGSGDRGAGESVNDFVSRMNRLADGNKMSFDIMMDNFRESFTDNSGLMKDGKTAFNSIEHLVAVDDDGFATSLIHGGSGAVSYMPFEVAGKMIIHNHPSQKLSDGTTFESIFSRADLRLGQEKGIVAQTESYDYIFQKKKNFNASAFDKQLTKSPVTDIITPNGNETISEAAARVNRETHNWLKANQKRYGYTYKRVKRK